MLVMSTMALMNMTSSLTYLASERTERAQNWGYPEATFMSLLGCWKLLELELGLKVCAR